jgi:hypothetical protein
MEWMFRRGKREDCDEVYKTKITLDSVHSGELNLASNLFDLFPAKVIDGSSLPLSASAQTSLGTSEAITPTPRQLHRRQNNNKHFIKVSTKSDLIRLLHFSTYQESSKI